MIYFTRGEKINIGNNQLYYNYITIIQAYSSDSSPGAPVFGKSSISIYWKAIFKLQIDNFLLTPDSLQLYRRSMPSSGQTIDIHSWYPYWLFINTKANRSLLMISSDIRHNFCTYIYNRSFTTDLLELIFILSWIFLTRKKIILRTILFYPD